MSSPPGIGLLFVTRSRSRMMLQTQSKSYAPSFCEFVKAVLYILYGSEISSHSLQVVL